MSQPDNTSDLLTVDEYAQLFKVSRTTVFSWLKTGDIQEGVHFIRIGRILRFRLKLDLLFSKKAPTITKRSPKKRPTSPGRKTPSSESAVNLDYGALTV